MINFRANYNQSTYVQKRVSTNNYIPQKVNLLEIDFNNSKDLEELSKVAKYWDGNNTFAMNIESTAKNIKAGWLREEKFHIYALSLQEDQFEKLDNEKVLGLVEIEKDKPDAVFINYIQVDPDIVYAFDNPEYKYCGTSMLNCIKKNFNNKLIYARSLVKDFFKKNKFVLIDSEKNLYMWKKSLK